MIDKAAMKKKGGPASRPFHGPPTLQTGWCARPACRSARHITWTGRAVALADERLTSLDRLSLEDLKAIHDAITEDVFGVLSVAASVKSRTSFGGTAPAEVAQADPLLEEAAVKRDASRGQNPLREETAIAVGAVFMRAGTFAKSILVVATLAVMVSACGAQADGPRHALRGSRRGAPPDGARRRGDFAARPPQAAGSRAALHPRRSDLGDFP